MKRLTATLLAAAMCMGTFAGCGSNTEETTDNSNAGAAAGETAAATTESQTASAENVHLDALNVYFVPSRDPEEIVTATEPLSDLLKNELAVLLCRRFLHLHRPRGGRRPDRTRSRTQQQHDEHDKDHKAEFLHGSILLCFRLTPVYTAAAKKAVAS